jgi:hypothetical protein
VSTWLPVSSVLSAYCCLDRRCVFKSLATPSYDRIISSASTTQFMHTCLLRATAATIQLFTNVKQKARTIRPVTTRGLKIEKTVNPIRCRLESIAVSKRLRRQADLRGSQDNGDVNYCTSVSVPVERAVREAVYLIQTAQTKFSTDQSFVDVLVDVIIAKESAFELIRRYYYVEHIATGAAFPGRRSCVPYNPPMPPHRAGWGLWGCRISSWPSKGGIIIRPSADAVEVAYLGLDRFDPRTEILDDQKSEDEFCKSLLKTGGTWWPSESRSKNIEINDGREEAAAGEERILRYIGWPKTGGVWIVEHAALEDQDHPSVADDIGRLRMCFTMEEKCEMLRDRFGPTFYEDPKDFHIFRDL